MTDFFDISYLGEGNPRQRRSLEILRQIRVMDMLAPYTPILVGTIPIGIDIPSSDLDIVCEVHEADRFEELLCDNFGEHDRFGIRRRCNTVVCGFFVRGEEIEIFGSPVPSIRNNAYRHMLIEYRLLNLLGEDFRRQIVKLKSQGIKTESAFAQLLGLPGDPYQVMLELETSPDNQLREYFLK